MLKYTLLPPIIRDYLALCVSFFLRSHRFGKHHRQTCTRLYKVCNTVLANELADARHDRQTFRDTFSLWRRVANMSKLPEATEEQRETKTEYEVYLRYGDEAGEFTVDVREDIVTLDGEPVTQEYIEGEIFDDYDKAKKRASQFEAFYAESIAEIGDQVNYYDEVEDDRD